MDKTTDPEIGTSSSSQSQLSKSKSSVCRRITQIFWLFTVFSTGYLLLLYSEGRFPIKNTAKRVLQQFVPFPREDCSNLAPISTAGDLPKLRYSRLRLELNQPDSNGNRLKADDPRIIKYIRSHCEVLLRPPDGKPTTYKGMGASRGEDEIALRLLNNMTGGFFVEFGALDGVKESNSLKFERDFGWKGLLIEPDPRNLVKLHRAHRNAWISHSCVAVKPYPLEVHFQQQGANGKIKNILENSHTETTKRKNALIRVQCFPLYSHLVALNLSVVDFMSVDVEGFELDILKTIPFDKILFKVVVVEIVTSRSPGPTRKFMESKGFKTVGTFYRHSDLKPFDLIFVHNSIKVEQSAIDLVKSKYHNPAYTGF